MKKIILTLLIAVCSTPFIKAQNIENTSAASQGIVLFNPAPIFFWAIAFDKETTTQVAENQAFKKEKQSKWAVIKQKVKQYKVLMGLLGFGAFGLLTKRSRKQLLKRRSEMSEGAGWCFGLLALFAVFGIGRLLGQYVFMLAGWPLSFFMVGFFAVTVIVFAIIVKKKSK